MQAHSGMNAFAQPEPRHFCPHTTDMITGYLVLFAGVSIVMGAANLPGATLDSQWVLLTLAGAIVASSTAFLLNPTREPARIVVGRALVSGVAGVVGSRLVAHKVSWLKDLLSGDHIFMFGAGFSLGLIGFVLAYAFIRTGFNRAQKIADHQIQRWAMPPQEDLPDDIKHARQPNGREN